GGRLAVALLAAATAAGACAGGGAADRPALGVAAVSTRPEAVTGGDVLLRVRGLDGADDLEVTVDGRDVTGAFTVEGDTATGLVTGLPPGASTVEARTGGDTATLEVVDHPVTGPVFSGPHLEPLACTTEQFGLGPATDDDCSAPTVVRWSYVDAGGEFVALDDPANPPADVATAEIDGREVPLIVRTESGTIDRGIYWIHVLDPSPTEQRWDPSAWNGTLVYRFGGGCGSSSSQGAPLAPQGGDAGPAADVDLLSQ